MITREKLRQNKLDYLWLLWYFLEYKIHRLDRISVADFQLKHLTDYLPNGKNLTGFVDPQIFDGNPYLRPVQVQYSKRQRILDAVFLTGSRSKSKDHDRERTAFVVWIHGGLNWLDLPTTMFYRFSGTRLRVRSLALQTWPWAPGGVSPKQNKKSKTQPKLSWILGNLP